MSDDERFDDLEGQRRRKGGVKLQYDSDSSVEDYNNIKKADMKDIGNKDEKKEEEEDGDDMFASDNKEDDMFASDHDENDDDVNENNNEINENSGLEVGEFNLEELEELKEGEEGEEDSNNFNSSDNDSDEKPNMDYYTKAEDFGDTGVKKTKWTPQIEAFNLKKEADEGVFDKDGNYERTKSSEDEKELQDFWMENIKKGDIKKANIAQEAQKKRSSRHNKPERRLDDLLALVSSLLQPVETPLEALSRSKNKLTVLEVEQISEAITFLEELYKFSGVYEMTREEFMRAYQHETGHAFSNKRKREDEENMENEGQGQEKVKDGEATNPKELDDELKIWEFRWINDDEIHGPYSAYEMDHWKYNYFENGVEVRKVGHETFSLVADIEF